MMQFEVNFFLSFWSQGISLNIKSLKNNMNDTGVDGSG